MFFKGFAHHRDDAIVDEARHGVFDHDFVIGKFGPNIVKIEWIECLGTHGIHPGSEQGRRF